MSSTTRLDRNVSRRDFLKTGVAAAVGSLAAGSGIALAGESSNDSKPIATRPFGKTGVKLPILGYGGAGLVKIWGSPLSPEDRVKLVRHAYDRGVRYYDTAGNYMESQAILGEALKDVRDNVFLVTKVETAVPGWVRMAVEKSLKELQTDYLDAT
jgi:aryl-alcohol dehydrogenase-like predicted oxidoreductase